MSYQIKRVDTVPDITGEWNSGVWVEANEVKIAVERPEGCGHKPDTRCKVLANEQGLYLLFKVEDNFVECAERELHGDVCCDSCVEFFIEPPGNNGYFNFEVNCCGVMLLYHIYDPQRVPGGGFKKFNAVPEKICKLVKIFHTMPDKLPTPAVGKITWRIGEMIPFEIFEREGVDAASLDLDINPNWRGNFYKCGSSRSHWLSWQPISELNFHLPKCFGKIEFVK
ncbi:MAG: carbohydrate-binding family 9-like protein [Lentisphaeria bacterium]|nr:carbohydrate-binding family 9-like protein [Lentisphaeria bacterium]